VPPLRDRREEIPHLSTFFLREACERLGKPDVQLSAEVLDLFSQYWWPGNVRQLKNEIQRAVAMSAPGGAIAPNQLSPEVSNSRLPTGSTLPRPVESGPRNLASAVEEMERQIIQQELRRASGNISETARTLGLTRRGLYLKLRRLGLETASDSQVDAL
jgi:DNA-binding NtrC family response regulator